MIVMKTSGVVAIDAINAALGPWSRPYMSLLVAISILGSANGIVICSARYLVMNPSNLSVLWKLDTREFPSLVGRLLKFIFLLI